MTYLQPSLLKSQLTLPRQEGGEFGENGRLLIDGSKALVDQIREELSSEGSRFGSQYYTDSPKLGERGKDFEVSLVSSRSTALSVALSTIHWAQPCACGCQGGQCYTSYQVRTRTGQHEFAVQVAASRSYQREYDNVERLSALTAGEVIRHKRQFPEDPTSLSFSAFRATDGRERDIVFGLGLPTDLEDKRRLQLAPLVEQYLKTIITLRKLISNCLDTDGVTLESDILKAGEMIQGLATGTT